MLLSWLAGDVARAAERRSAPLVAGIVAALAADHGDLSVAATDTDWTAATEPDADAAEMLTARLAHVRAIFDLDGLDARLLLSIVAPDLDANIASAFEFLTGTPGQTTITGGLALELAGRGSLDGESRARLAPTGRLGRAGLLVSSGSGGLLRRHLESPDRLTGFLIGDDTPPAVVKAAVTDPVALPLPGHDVIARSMEHGAPLIWVREAIGAAALSLCAGAADALAVGRLCIDARRLAEPLAASLDEVLLEAALTGRALILAGAERLTEAPSGEALGLLARLHRSAVPVLACSRRVWDPEWLPELPVLVEAGHLEPLQRQELWTELLGESIQMSSDGEDGEPATSEWNDLIRLRITPEEMVRTVRGALVEAQAHDDPLTLARVRSTARKLVGGSVQGATNRSADASFDDLILGEDTLALLHELTGWARNREAVLGQGPVAGAGGKGRGIVALFSGGPGTGKTLAATVVASALGLDLQTVDLSAIVDKYIGETEKNLEKVFAEAEALNAVLFFDEADALFGSRSEVRDSRDRYANQEVAFLLQRMEVFNGIAILATNLAGNLDAAFSRRLHFIVNFPDPDAATRARLWTQHLAGLSGLDPDDPVDVELLAERAQFSGGDIRNVVLAAAYRAAALRRHVGARILADATAREFRKLGRRVPPEGFLCAAPSVRR